MSDADKKPTNLDVWISEWNSYKTECEKRFSAYSGKSSDFSRQVAFAGIAIVWVFRETVGKGFAVSGVFAFAASMFFLALAVEAIHYLWGVRLAAKELDKIQQLEAEAVAKGQVWNSAPTEAPPVIPDQPLKAFFWIRQIVVLVGAIALLSGLVEKYQ